MSIKPIISLLIIIPVSILQGCASFGVGNSDFGCQSEEYQNGAVCTPTRDLYVLTNDKDRIKHKKIGSTDDDSDSDSNIDGESDNKKITKTIVIEKKLTIAPAPGHFTPIRTPSGVMRMYIAPWEDKNEVLHAPGYVFIEVEQRKWAVGEQYVQPFTQLRPIQVSNPVETQDKSVNTNTNKNMNRGSVLPGAKTAR